MANYNANAMAAYQQYGQTMAAGGGGSNMSGTGSSTMQVFNAVNDNDDDRPSGLASRPTTTEDKKPSFWDKITSVFQQNEVDVTNVYKPSVDPSNVYTQEMFEMVPAASDYVYRAEMSEQTQDMVEQAMGYEKPQLGQLQLLDTGAMTEEEKKRLGPLIDLADDIRNQSITTTELPPIKGEEQSSLMDALMEGQPTAGLMSRPSSFTGGSVQVASNIPNWMQDMSAAELTDALVGISQGTVDPETGQRIQTAEDFERETTEEFNARRRRERGLPEIDTAASTSTDENFLETPTFKLLEGVEGFKSKPYSLNNYETLGGKPHKSGLTVGAGIDFGQHSEQSLLDMGIPKTMVDKAKNAGWIGLNPDTIIDPKTGKTAATRARGHELMYDKFVEQKNAGTLPTFTDDELSQATPPVYQTYEDAAKKQYEKDTGLSFDDLDVGSKAVLTLEKYHRGVNYKLPSAMIIGASQGNSTKAAQGTKNPGRRKNLAAWLKKVGLDYDSVRRETSPRPMLRPE